MDDLNKHQIILLCILISFVVSIATGIMTTSLLMQAPVELTQTVNRVVERTIDTITPASPTAPTSAPTKQTTTTVVVSEDQSVTSAISKNTPALVRINEKSADGSVDQLYGFGMVISDQGIIVADKQSISDAMIYTATMADGTVLPLFPIPSGKNWEVNFFKAKPTKPYTFSPASLSTSDAQLGQTVIVIGGDTTNTIAVGRVLTVNTKDVAQVGTTTPVKYVSSIDTDIAPTDSVPGAPLLSLSGDLVGIGLSDFASLKTYLPSAIISQEENSIVLAQ